MAIEITCECGKGYCVSDDKAGKRFKCRDCGTLLQVPNANGGATDDEDDGDDDVEMEPDAEYVPAHHRAAAKARSAKKSARDQKWAAVWKRWLLIGGGVVAVIGGLTYANARIPQVMMRIWPVILFFLQFLLAPTIVFFLGQCSCRRRIREEIGSHDGTVTNISWQPFQGLPFTKAWGLGIHPVGGLFYSVTYTDRDGTTQHSTVGFTARGMRWDGDI